MPGSKTNRAEQWWKSIVRTAGAGSATTSGSFNDPAPKTLGQLRFRIQRLFWTSDSNASAMEHLIYILPSGCLVKGDLVSIALNTTGIPLSFTGEVSSEEDVIWMFSILVLASGDLVPFITSDGLAQSKLRIADPSTPNGHIISWVPKVTLGALDYKLPVRNPSTITGDSREYIELDLLLFKASPSLPAPESWEKAGAIITQFQLDVAAQEAALRIADPNVAKTAGLMASTAKSAGGKDRPGPMATFHQNWLATLSIAARTGPAGSLR